MQSYRTTFNDACGCILAESERGIDAENSAGLFWTDVPHRPIVGLIALFAWSVRDESRIGAETDILVDA